jgi:hypothetical protein
MNQLNGKLSAKEETIARALKVAPWLTLPITSLPAPIIFLVFFFTASATDSAAFYLLFSALSFAFGFIIGLVLLLILAIYRRGWLSRLRDRLASDGITADEVVWFKSELTSAEQRSLAELERTNALLADAYRETLATRLTASRIMASTRRELLKVERRINRARALSGAETDALLGDLASDRQELELMRQHASEHLAKAQTRLQIIEATASRSLDQAQTDVMMRRLSASQDQFPLSVEMANLERRALQEAENEVSGGDN